LSTFQTKLQLLQDEIQRLKDIQRRLEKARDRGDRELPPWLQENEQFQQLLAKVRNLFY
jgi:DNA-binding GntR family transcriptional regulator